MSALNALECYWHLRGNVKGEKAWKAQSSDPPTLGGPELAGGLLAKSRKARHIGNATVAMKRKRVSGLAIAQSRHITLHGADIEAQVLNFEVLSSSIGSPGPNMLWQSTSQTSFKIWRPAATALSILLH